MTSIRVEPEKGTVRAEGGVTIGELDHETQAFGLAVPMGVVTATGIAGLTLGGGLGWLRRMHGLTFDNLISVDVVTADGQLITASEEQNGDLFWGVQGRRGKLRGRHVVRIPGTSHRTRRVPRLRRARG
jgi:FAD/FMN-containing dehydrogenase